MDIDTVKVVLGEYRINNADVTLRHDASTEELIDVIEGNRVYIPCIYVLNKIDQISIEVCDSFLLGELNTLRVEQVLHLQLRCLGRFYMEYKLLFDF